MARINLLPWREQLREERKQRFLATLVGVLVVAAGLVFLGDQYLNGAIEQQNARNEFIRKEIAVLDARIKEISELKTRRQQLLERMKIIQDLQGNRPIIVRLFDQLVRTLPDGVYYTSLMRNLDASDWLTQPNLTAVKAVTAGTLDQANVFQLTVQQTQPSVEEEGVKK